MQPVVQADAELRRDRHAVRARPRRPPRATIARSSAGLAGTAAPPPLRVTLAAGQPKLRSMWSTSPAPHTRSTARPIITGSEPYTCRLRGCSSGPNVIIRAVLALPWTSAVAITISLT